jgi:hypothetical protein
MASGHVSGPHEDGSGPVTLYIGPGVEEEYPAMADNSAYDALVKGKWCPGTYTGEITHPGAGLAVVTATFQFGISATMHVRPPSRPAVARHLKPVAVSPGLGGRGTVFAVRYRADAAPYNSGDVLDVDGPRHSPCSGGLVRQLSERPDGRTGPVTLHVGPGADRNNRWASDGTGYSPGRGDGTGPRLERWCTGTYTGTILYEHYAKLTVIGRFEFHVDR